MKRRPQLAAEIAAIKAQRGSGVATFDRLHAAGDNNHNNHTPTAD